MKTYNNNIFHLMMATLALLLWCSVAQAKNAPPGTGEADVKANIFILLDTSASMTNPVNAGTAFGINGPNDLAVDELGRVHVQNYSGGTVTVWDNSGNKIADYDVGGTVAKITVDSNHNTYVKTGGKLKQFAYNGDASNPAWTAGWEVTTTIGTGDSSDLEVWFQGSSNDLVITTAGDTKNVEVFDATNGDLLKTEEVEPSGLYPMAIDNVRNIMYLKSGSKLKAFNISSPSSPNMFSLDSEITLSSSIVGSQVYDLEIDGDGNVHILDKTKHDVDKYAGAWTAGGMVHIGTSDCSGFGGEYGFGIDNVNKLVYVVNYSDDVIDVMQYGTGDTWTCLPQLGVDEDYDDRSKHEIARAVIRALMLDPSLTTGANFGFMRWDGAAEIKVPISPTGFQTIYDTVDSYPSDGGSTKPAIAMELAKDYFSGNTAHPDPKDPDATCQNQFIILVSDGLFGDDPDDAAEEIFNDLGIKSFIVGFGLNGGNAAYASFAAAGQTNAPLYADDEASLTQTLSTAISQAITMNLTFSAPRIMPDVTLGDHILQALFEYKTDRQWYGKLYKYGLDTDGSIVEPFLWDAGAQLNAKAASARKIWSVGTSYPAGINNFTIANVATIKNDIYAGVTTPAHGTGTEPNNIINFMRGIDVFDYDGDSDTTEALPWKLGDIYHSKPAIVGKPPGSVNSDRIYSEGYYNQQNGYETFQTLNNDRKTIILAGSNAGMLHAFDFATGDELWSFIPPSMLPNLRGIISSNPNQTIPIYGVDGSPVVKDIYYNNSWRTVVICGLGLGGMSYFALDITDTENPTHLFTFSNDPGNEKLHYWNAAGVKVTHEYDAAKPPIDADYDYRLLGHSLSTPRIIRIKVSNADKWVAIFGAGFNNNVTTDYGSAVFVIDMEDGGKVLNSIAVTDVNDPGSNPVTNNVINSVPADLVPITADSTSLIEFHGALVYFADYEGKLWKLNLSDQGTLYDLQYLFDAEATAANERRVMFEVGASIDATTNKLWLYYGTGNQQDLQSETPTMQNKLYGIKDKNFPAYDASVVSVTETSCVNISGLASCVVAGFDEGWYANLDAKEKVTGAPAIYNNTVYFSRYIPNALNPCNPGTAKISSHDYSVGCQIEKIELGEGVATAPTFYGGAIYVGLSGAEENETALDDVPGWNMTGNIIQGAPPAGRGTTGGIPKINSWRHLY